MDSEGKGARRARHPTYCDEKLYSFEARVCIPPCTLTHEGQKQLPETDGTAKKVYRLVPCTALLRIYTVPYRTVQNFRIPYRTDIGQGSRYTVSRNTVPQTIPFEKAIFS